MEKGGCSRPRRSKLSRREEVRVIHIGNPRMVKASPSEFSAVVQSLTGLVKKRLLTPSTCTSTSMQMEWESPKSKLPRHQSDFQFCSNLGIPESTALLPHKAQESSNKYGSADHEQEICRDMFSNQYSSADHEQEICSDMFSNQYMMNTLDCFDGKILPDIFSFDFMSSASDVV